MIRLLLAILLLMAGPALAVQPDEILKDPALEARARALSAELRCLVCQNQSIDDSEAPLARDLRLLIREHLVKGETDGEVADYVVERYGDYVLLKPRFTVRTWILWLTPFAVLIFGAFALWRHRQGTGETERPLSDAEKIDLERALK